MSEFEFERQLVIVLRKLGYLVYVQKPVIEISPGHLIKTGILEGASDLLILTPQGIVVFAELKSRRGKQRDSQKIFEAEVKSRSGVYVLLNAAQGLQKAVDVIRLSASNAVRDIAYKNRFTLT